MNSWKTTSAGIAMIVTAVIALIFALKNHTLDEAKSVAIAVSVLGGIGFFFTKDSDVTGGTKQFKMIAVLMLLSLTFCGKTHAQKFYLGKLPKPVAARSLLAWETMAPATQNIFGPVANIVSYSAIDQSLLYGAGIGYKHMKWDEQKGEYVEIWSINGLAWNKVSLSGEQNRFAYGVAGGFTLGSFLAKGLIGVATTDITQISKYFPTIGLTLPINR